jgi:hypothetical protein
MSKQFSLFVLFSLLLVAVLAVAPKATADTGVLFEDTFTDVDNTLIEVHNPLWAYFASEFAPVKIINNQAVADTNANSIYTVPSINGEDMCVQADIIVSANKVTFIDFFSRYAIVPGQPLVQFWFNGDGTGFTHAYGTDIDVEGSFPADLPNGSHTVTYCEFGSDISWYIDSAVQGAITDPNPVISGTPGFSTSPGTVFDNFKIFDTNPALPSPTPSPSPSPSPSPTPAPQIVALSPAQVWVGQRGGNRTGLKFDLKADIYKGDDIIGSGQVSSVDTGKPGFNSVQMSSIPLTLTTPVSMNSGDQLKFVVSVRNACVGSTQSSGVARLWYNDATANSGFGATIDSSSNNYYLLSGFALGTTSGSGPKLPADVSVGAQCSAFAPFGTWTMTF